MFIDIAFFSFTISVKITQITYNIKINSIKFKPITKKWTKKLQSQTKILTNNFSTPKTEHSFSRPQPFKWLQKRSPPLQLPGWEVDLGTAGIPPAAVAVLLVMLWRFLTAAIAPHKVSGGEPNALHQPFHYGLLTSTPIR